MGPCSTKRRRAENGSAASSPPNRHGTRPAEVMTHRTVTRECCMRLHWAIAIIGILLSCRDGEQGTVAPNAFADGAVALVQNVDDPAWPQDPVRIDSATITGED